MHITQSVYMYVLHAGGVMEVDESGAGRKKFQFFFQFGSCLTQVHTLHTHIATFEQFARM